MIRFLLKGLLRDRSRSFLSIMVVTTGVFLTVFLYTWLTGIFGDIVDNSARFETGHVKIMSRIYAENSSQNPNDLALDSIMKLKTRLNAIFPEMTWVDRIKFNGLIDVPDIKGETKAQGPVFGLAVDLFSPDSKEIERLNILKAIKRGEFPKNQSDILISEELSRKLNINPGDIVTLLSSTMYGSLTTYNFKISGTLRFGMAVMDRGTIIVDINDARKALDMSDAAGEILGYFKSGIYNNDKAIEITHRFNSLFQNDKNEFAPVMIKLEDQSNLGELIAFSNSFGSLLAFIFILVMSIVLWNMGLVGGLRRYGEIGVRLAIGENKSHIYNTMVYESVLVGLTGSLIGSAIGLFLSYIMQRNGIDFSNILKNVNMMYPAVFRTRITTPAYYLGFIPGLFSIVLGTMLSGIGIYKRQTASLFKELEA